VQVLLGALIAGAFALAGAWYNQTREHEHWLRERRLTAYADFSARVSTLTTSNWIDPDQPHAQLLQKLEAAYEALGQVSIVGPPGVDEKAAAVMELVADIVGANPKGVTATDVGAARKEFRNAASQVIQRPRRRR